MYTKPRKFEETYKWILEMVQGQKQPETNIERAMATALESTKSFMYIEFESNSKAQGSIVGLGKEPDVPYSNQALVVRDIGSQHRDVLRFLPVGIFICSEDYNFKEKKHFLYLSGARVFGKLVIPPSVETTRMSIERDHNKMLKSVGTEISDQVSLDHKGWINAYLGM